SCRAYEAYQRRYVGRVEPEHIVEFLLLDPNFPRSVRFCLEAASRALTGIGGRSEQGLSHAERILGRVLSDLVFGEVAQILKGDLHAFLTRALERCAQASRAVQDQYALH